MFGLGMGEIVLIAVVALLVLGPERLPGAAKAIGKGIRDLRQQTKALQSTIESDTQIGEAVREIKGALRGDPETLYKKVTGDDWQGSDSPPIASSKAKSDDDTKSDKSSASEKSSASDNESSKLEASQSDDTNSESSKSDVSENDSPDLAENDSPDEAASNNDSPDKADPASATRDFVKELIDKEFSNTDDAWGKAPVNPHEADEADESPKDDSSDNSSSLSSVSDIQDPDMPIIKPASNTMARHDAIDDEGDQDDQDPSDTANV